MKDEFTYYTVSWILEKEIKKQSKLNGFELFTINEWSVFDN